MPVRAFKLNACDNEVASGAGPTTMKLNCAMKSVNVPRGLAGVKAALETTKKFVSLNIVKPHPTVLPGAPEIVEGVTVRMVLACAAGIRSPTRNNIGAIRLM